jgi:hypothetical protein
LKLETIIILTAKSAKFFFKITFITQSSQSFTTYIHEFFKHSPRFQPRENSERNIQKEGIHCVPAVETAGYSKTRFDNYT